MAIFTVPVVITSVGWYSLDADSLEDAKEQAEKLQTDENFDFNQVEDRDHTYDTYEVMVDEIEELTED